MSDCKSFSPEQAIPATSSTIDGRDIITTYLTAATSAETITRDSVAEQIFAYQETGEMTDGVKALITVTDAFIDAIRKSCIKKASGLLPSAKAHIVCADASKLVWRAHEPFLCIGNALIRKFGFLGSEGAKKDIADFVQAALAESISQGNANGEIAMSCEVFDFDRYGEANRISRFYNLAEAGKIVQSRELTLRWGLPDADRLRSRDVWDSDVDAYIAGVPLEDIFA